MHTFPRRAAALLAVLSLGVTGVGSAQASATPRGLLDGLGGIIGGVVGGLTSILNGLLGPAQLAPLTQLTASLTPGTTPSAQTLAPLTSLVSGVAGNASVPADLRSQASGVLDILNTGTATPLSTDSLNKVTGLLGSLALTQGLSSAQVSALNGVVAAIQSTVGSVVGGLPIVGGVVPGAGGAPVGTGLVNSLSDLAALLAAGQIPTGSALGPVTALLREVAAGVPEPLKSTITQLADAIDATTGQLTEDLLGPLTTVLGQIAATPGVAPGVASQLGPLATSLQRASSGTTPGTTTKAKTTYATAKMSKVKVDRKRGKIVVDLSCTSLAFKCAAILTPMRGKTAAGKSVIVLIPAGGTATRKLSLSKAALRLMKRKAVKFSVTGVNQRGTIATKSITTKVPKKKR